MPLTERDEELIMTLVMKTRVLSLDQIADTWWQGLAYGQQCARRRLAILAQGKLVNRLRIMARPLPPLPGPLACWKPEEQQPQFEPVAWKLRSRWQQPARQITAVVATKVAARRFGGKNSHRLKHRHQVTHDLGVSQVYLHFRTHTPARALRWMGEDRLPKKRGQKVPDAMLESTAELPQEAIEFGGSYDATRLKTFHHYCQQRQLGYEIW